MGKISAYLKDLFEYFDLKKRANFYLSPIKSYWFSKMTPSWSFRFSRLSKNGYNGLISSPKNTSKHLVFGPNLIFYHRGELKIANSIDKWAKNQEIHILINYPSNKTVRNRPGRGRRPTADYGTFSGALLFCFLNQNWCRDPQKAKKWFDYQKKTKVALDYI